MRVVKSCIGSLGRSGKGLFIAANEETPRKLWTVKSLETNFSGLFAEIFISILAILMRLLRFINFLSGMVESQF